MTYLFPISQAHSGPGANSVAFGSQATKSTDATTRATAAALTTTTMSTTAHDGDGEHVASLGGGGAATVPKGASVPGRVSGLHDNVDWEVVK